MKNYQIISAVLFVIMCSFVPFNANSQHSIEKATLNLKVKNISHERGAIFIAVYDKKELYMKERFYEDRVGVHSREDIDVKLKLPLGEYAVSIFHDVNNDNDLNTNLLGIPKEPYGFSNNSRSAFGPPDFEAATFDFKNDGYEMEIILK